MGLRQDGREGGGRGEVEKQQVTRGRGKVTGRVVVGVGRRQGRQGGAGDVA